MTTSTTNNYVLINNNSLCILQHYLNFILSNVGDFEQSSNKVVFEQAIMTCFSFTFNTRTSQLPTLQRVKCTPLQSGEQDIGTWVPQTPHQNPLAWATRPSPTPPAPDRNIDHLAMISITRSHLAQGIASAVEKVRVRWKKSARGAFEEADTELQKRWFSKGISIRGCTGSLRPPPHAPMSRTQE